MTVDNYEDFTVPWFNYLKGGGGNDDKQKEQNKEKVL